MASFLPSNYEAPQSGNYMKLQQGENRIRVLGPAIVGNMFWQTKSDGSRHPVRRRMNEPIQDGELGMDNEGKRERVKHFWAFPVWNVKANQVQILELTQATVREQIMALCQSEDWGDPTGYDLVIKKSGSGLDTEYAVVPGKVSATPTEASREFLRINPNMEALFDGGDPFAAGSNGNGKPTTNAAPAAQPQPQSIEVEVKGVNDTPKNGKTVYVADTDQGRFGTFDPAIGKAAMGYVGRRVVFDWVPAGKDSKKIVGVSAVPAGGDHVPLGDDDIPF